MSFQPERNAYACLLPNSIVEIKGARTMWAAKNRDQSDARQRWAVISIDEENDFGVHPTWVFATKTAALAAARYAAANRYANALRVLEAGDRAALNRGR